MSTNKARSRPAPSETVGSIIKTAREDLGIPLSRLAERIGVSKGVIGDVETNRYKRVRPDLLIKLATALEIDERKLFTIAGYPYLVELPDLPVYLRTKYQLSPEALAHMKAQWAFAQEHYGIQVKDDPTQR